MSYTALGTAASDYIAQLAQKNAGDDGGYSARAVQALNMVVTDPQAQSALAPMVRTGVSIFEVAQQQWTTAAGASSGQMPGALMSFVNDLTDTLAKSTPLIAGAASAVGEAVGEAIPILGAVVSMWGSGQAMISASHSAVIQNLINNCTGPEGYVPVTPTGVGKMMPADIFVARWEGGAPALTVTGPTGKVVVMKPAVAPTPVPTSLGRAMIAMTECNPMDASRFGAKGVPAATQAKFKAMRLAIEASAVHPEITDGGTKIWPIYIDLLRAEFDNGDLTVPYARYLWVLDCGGWDAGMIPNVLANANNAAQGRFGLMSPWETGNSANPYTGYVECKKWDQRAFNGVMAIVNAWRLAVLPKWGSDRAALSAQLALAAAQIKAAAQAAAAAKLRSGTIASPFMSTAIAAGLKKSTTVITTPTPPIAAIMIGLVLGAGALALYKHRRAL